MMDEKRLRTELARRLKELREVNMHGISQRAVSDLAKERYHLKISPKTIYDYEHPESCNPQLDKLQALATVYGTSLGELLAFTSPKADSRMVVQLTTITKDPIVRSAISSLLSKLIVRPDLPGDADSGQ